MEFRLFTYTSHGSSLKSALILQEEIDDLDNEESKDVGAYFIGGNIEQWTDHGIVNIIGEKNMMMDTVMVSN